MSSLPYRAFDKRKLAEILVGAPTRILESESPTYAGRTQTRMGAWWERHPRLLQGLALLALTWLTVYLIWRIGWSWREAVAGWG